MAKRQKEDDHANPVSEVYKIISAEEILDMLEHNLDVTKKYFKFDGFKAKGSESMRFYA